MNELKHKELATFKKAQTKLINIELQKQDWATEHAITLKNLINYEYAYRLQKSHNCFQLKHKSGKTIRIWVKWDKEPYMTFAKEFKYTKQGIEYASSAEKQLNIAETLNVEVIDFAVKRNVDYIIFLNAEMGIYFISLENFIRIAGNFIRKQDTANTEQTAFNGRKIFIREEEYCIPIQELKNISEFNAEVFKSAIETLKDDLKNDKSFKGVDLK